MPLLPVLRHLTLGLACLAPAAQAQVRSDPIRVGVILPLSGGSSDMGHSARIGAQVAIDEFNEVGGYLGRPFELVIRDDKADPDTGRRHAEELVKKVGVMATVGFCNTGVAAKALDVFQDHRHVLIVSCATGSLLTAKYPPAESYIFRTSARDALQTRFLAAELVKRGLSRPALIVDKSGYGDAGLKDLEIALAEVNIRPVGSSRVDLQACKLEYSIVSPK